MSIRIEEIKKRNFPRSMDLIIHFVVSFSITLLLTSSNTLDASTGSALQSNFTETIQPQQSPSQQLLQVPQQDSMTITPQQQLQEQLLQQQLQQLLQVPQTNQGVSSPTQPPQISWDELEETDSFIANGNINSTIYTINGNWKATGDWNMNVVDGELTAFNTTMAWHNGTAGHTHEFLNFEATDDGVDISAEDQTISVAGTMDVGTNGAAAWEDVPSEIVIEGGKIITVSVDNEATDEHFSGQSVFGNLASLRVCSTTPGPAMQVSSAC
jgi:hypothetical protein